jgi:predicted AAA+ superfamily ATPase
LVLGSPDRNDVIIDEIQRIPELLNVVHDLIESGARRRFILTGSSARKLRRGGMDLLAGRAVMRSLHPFMAAEMGTFDMEQALETGTVPLVVSAEDQRDTLRAYAGLYLEQEVRAEGMARDVGAFARFLEAAAFSHASVLNVANLAREAQVSRTTVTGHMEVLEDLLLGFRLPIFTRRAKRQLTAHPKFYYFDSGVFRALRPAGPLDRPEEIQGAALEGLVAQHLRAWISYRKNDSKLSFWRTRSGVEVDFVIYGPEGLWALEVKNTGRVRPEDLRGLRAFCRDYPPARGILLYRGEDRLNLDGVYCVPTAEFLGGLRPEKNLAAAAGI